MFSSQVPSVPKTHNHPHRVDDDLLQDMLQVSSTFPQNVYMDNDEEDEDDDEIPAYDEYPELPQQKQLPQSFYQFPTSQGSYNSQDDSYINSMNQGSYKNQDIPIFEVSILNL